MIGERTDSLSPIAFYKLGQFIYYKGEPVGGINLAHT